MSDDDSDHTTTCSLTGERLSPRRMQVDTGDGELVVGSDANPVEHETGVAITVESA
jgi:hypothetical protein